jgi:hypothetical protein
MNRWFHLLGALTLVLLVWTSSSAYAAQRHVPLPAVAESAGHYVGDRDEVPSDEHNGAPHHHLACGEHLVAAWADEPAVAIAAPTVAQKCRMSRTSLDGREPDSELRPPIA